MPSRTEKTNYSIIGPSKKLFLQENFQRRGGIWILHCIALHFIDGMLASLFA
jgi:hypothetical protein